MEQTSITSSQTNADRKIEQTMPADLENGVDASTMDARASSRSMDSSLYRKSSSPPLHDKDEQPIATNGRRSLLTSWNKKRGKSFLRYILVIFAFLLIGAVIAVGVVLVGKNKKERLSPRQQQLSDIVATVSDSAKLSNSATPQAKARHWLLFNDKLWVREDLVVTREMAVQRYVLAVFYFATSGSSWKQNNWLKGRECASIWSGIDCNANNQVRTLTFRKYFLVSFGHYGMDSLHAHAHVNFFFPLQRIMDLLELFQLRSDIFRPWKTSA